MFGSREEVALRGGPLDGERHRVYTNTREVRIPHKGWRYLVYFRSQGRPGEFVFVEETSDGSTD